MADQIKLKAFVRIDGSGKVIPGGPIFQAQKPKVGKWREISIKECCNYNPNTTTTTTSSTSSTSTSTTTTTTTEAPIIPTLFVKAYWQNTGDSCSAETYGDLTFYSASETLVPGVTVFTDEALTIPVTEGYVISANPFTYPRMLVGAGGVLSAYTCPTYRVLDAIGAFDPISACGGAGTSLTLYSSIFAPLGVGTAIYMDSALTVPYNTSTYGGYIKLYFAAQDQVCTMSGNTIQSYTGC
jgi:hypothetical protein